MQTIVELDAYKIIDGLQFCCHDYLNVTFAASQSSTTDQFRRLAGTQNGAVTSNEDVIRTVVENTGKPESFCEFSDYI